MNARLAAVGATLRRFLPALVALVIVVMGYIFFGQARIADMLRWQTEARGLENRVATLRTSVERTGRLTTAGTDDALRQFEARTPTEDRVADVIEMLAKRAQDPKAPGRLRGLLIEAGQRVPGGGSAPASPGSGPRVVAAPMPDSPSRERVDPRLALFGGPFDYTPVSLSFLSTYDRVGDFFWRCRDLPTTVEIRTVEISRGLPLVKVRMTLFVYQRPAAAPPPATAQVAN